MSDLISRQAAIDEIQRFLGYLDGDMINRIHIALNRLPSAQPERLTDDDFETIRIHLNAYKEKLCNQHRWKEAEEYQRIIDRFMGFASQPTIEPRAKGAWVEVYDSGVGGHNSYSCSNCGLTIVTNPDYLKKHKFCFACGADMREETE